MPDAPVRLMTTGSADINIARGVTILLSARSVKHTVFDEQTLWIRRQPVIT